jgi:hypothetical protein
VAKETDRHVAAAQANAGGRTITESLQPGGLVEDKPSTSSAQPTVGQATFGVTCQV